MLYSVLARLWEGGLAYRAWALLFILGLRVLQEPQLKGISVNNVRAFVLYQLKTITNMKTKLLSLFLTLASCVGTIFATGTKIGDLYYNLNSANRTAFWWKVIPR